jgi:hypothetical protein
LSNQHSVADHEDQAFGGSEMVRTQYVLVGALLIGTFTETVTAAAVTPTEYTMQNGQSGNYVYRDTTYLPCPSGSCDTSLAFLSGGTGRLTDGLLTPSSWYESGESWGSPTPWIGWDAIDPLITFIFAGAPAISRVGLYLDNTPGNGDVRLPGSVDIGGINYTVTADASWGARWLYFDIPNTVSNSLEVKLNRDNGNWIMLGEVSFETAASPAPEPATTTMIGVGILAIAYRYRKSIIQRKG